MICPRCAGEFVHGVNQCPDCRVALVDEVPQAPQDRSEAWVTIAKIANPSELLVMKSLLASNEIPVYVPGEHSFQQIPALHLLRHTTFRGGECELQVPASFATEARDLLASLPPTLE